MANIRLALRVLGRNPIVTVVAAASLALGIGSNAAIFSLYSQALLRPVPVPEPERLVNLAAPGPKPGSISCGAEGTCEEVFSYPMFRDLQREQTVLDTLAAHRSFPVSVTYRERTTPGAGALVSGSYFPTLGVAPAAGRLFGPEVDETIGGYPVVVLSHEFWQSDLGGSPDVIGDPITINGELFTVVGVAPAGFHGTTLDVRPAIFAAMTMGDVLSVGDSGLGDRRRYWVYVFGRLQPDVSIQQARVALEILYRGILADVEAPLQVDLSPQTLARFLTRPLLLREGTRGQSRLDEAVERPILLLLAVTGIVVLIACANIANLLLARAVVRMPEMALRLSLGASRRRLLAQLLTESCLLAAVGGAGAPVVAHWTLRFVAALLPRDVADTLRLELDPHALPFIAVVSLLTAMLFGVLPALRSTRPEVMSTLRDNTGQIAGAGSSGRYRNVLVVAQLALATTLLAGAGLSIQSLRNTNRIDLGIRTDGVVTFTVSPGPDYGDTRTHALHDRIEAQLAAVPGVEAVTATANALFFGGRAANVVVDGFTAEPDTDRHAHYNQVAPGYFNTLGIPVLAGRPFTELDTRPAAKVAIVNEAFARKFGLGRDAVGTHVARGALGTEPDTEIVGVVADTRSGYIHNPDPALLYVPYRRGDGMGTLSFYVRSGLPPDGLLRAIPRLVAEVDSNLPVTSLEELARRVWELNYELRVGTILSTAFAVLGTLLAGVGLYGVLAYAVAQRTREMGVRMALGADPGRLRNMVLGQIGRMTLAGSTVGLVAALGVERAARAVLYEVDGLPPGVMAAAVAGLAAIALAAGYIPAERASRTDPVTALRQQ